jgi:hypothetical protein
MLGLSSAWSIESKPKVVLIVNIVNPLKKTYFRELETFKNQNLQRTPVGTVCTYSGTD